MPYKKPFILENTNQLVTPEKNAMNLQTYCFNSALHLFVFYPAEPLIVFIHFIHNLF